MLPNALAPCRACSRAAWIFAPSFWRAKRQLHAEADYLAEARHLPLWRLLNDSDVFVLPALPPRAKHTAGAPR